MFNQTVQNASFLISAMTFFALFLLFIDTLFLRFDLKIMLKTIGFALLSATSWLNLFAHGFSSLTLWIGAFASMLIFFSFILDSYSRLRLLFPLPLLFAVFLREHILIAIITILISIAVFHLVYRTKHKDLVPVGIGFALIAIGEILYALGGAGSFLYLFASMWLLFWVWSYVALRIFYLFKGLRGS